jgi:predicted phosphodiesterase
MAKYDYLNEEAVKHIEINSNNTHIAKKIFPEGTALEIERLRKHIATIRVFGLPKEIKVKDGFRQSKKSLAIEPYLNGNTDNILVIGDIHAPFTLPTYLKFCRQQQETYDCGTVIFIGDIIDNHYSSYHESDPDGYSAGEELDRAIDMIKDWYRTFPIATVIIGNHDRLVYRKAFSAGVSKRWIRDYKDVLNTDGWDFTENTELFDIDINHGEGGTAKNRMKSELRSQVQGHLHTQLYVEYAVGANFIVWGMQVGCGIDIKSYAMAYGKNYKKPAIGCGVILNKGTLPIAIPMKM